MDTKKKFCSFHPSGLLPLPPHMDHFSLIVIRIDSHLVSVVQKPRVLRATDQVAVFAFLCSRLLTNNLSPECFPQLISGCSLSYRSQLHPSTPHATELQSSMYINEKCEGLLLKRLSLTTTVISLT